MRIHNIAVIPGDGIGPEVVNEGLKVLHTLGEACGFRADTKSFDWGAERYLETGEYMPDDGIDILRPFDAIFLGSVGDPRVPDEVNHALSFGIRFNFEQYVNYRPVKLYPNVPTVLKDSDKKSIDFVILRENTEGAYVNAGGRFKVGTPDEVGTQTAIITRKGSERLIRYGFELAKQRYDMGKSKNPHVTSCTKGNVLKYGMHTWDDAFEAVAKEYPTIGSETRYVDAMGMWLVKNPEMFDVVCCTNLFGDIMTDIAALLQGGLGFASSGSINPERKYPSGFESMHGSAPKYKGKNVINPMATILTVKIMLEHLGEFEAANLLDKALNELFSEKAIMTRDMGGSMKTSEVGDAICARIRELA